MSRCSIPPGLGNALFCLLRPWDTMWSMAPHNAPDTDAHRPPRRASHALTSLWRCFDESPASCLAKREAPARPGVWSNRPRCRSALHPGNESKCIGEPFNNMRSNMKTKYPRTIQRCLSSVGVLAFCALGSALAQNKAIDFKKGMPFSDGYVAGNTLYVAGQQGPDSQGKVTETDITQQTTSAISAIEKVVKKAGFQMTDITSVTVYVTDLNDVPKMNDVYKKLMPDPKPARATVQVAGLIGGAKIEISAIAVKH